MQVCAPIFIHVIFTDFHSSAADDKGRRVLLFVLFEVNVRVRVVPQ